MTLKKTRLIIFFALFAAAFLFYPNQKIFADTGCSIGNLFSAQTGQPCPPAVLPVFTRTLGYLSSGEDVRELQKFLNSQGFLVAATGPGSIGNETSFFGNATRSALIRYQNANNIPPVGVFGPITLARTNALIKEITTTAYEKVLATRLMESQATPSESQTAPRRRGGGSRGGGSSNPADTIAPTVSITAPAASAVVSGASVSITATASDNVAVAGVSFYADDVLIGAQDTSVPYSVIWNSAAVSDGSVDLIAVAVDTSNNETDSLVVTVVVDNTAPVISSVSSGDPGVTNATIAWTTNEDAESKVLYGLTSLYGSEVSSATLTTSHSQSLTGLAANTTYHFAVVSTDGQGNVRTSPDGVFTTDAVPFPSGAIGLWYVDEYEANPRPVIANAVSGAGVSKNLFAASRNLFGKEGWWEANSAIATNHATLAPDGTMSGTTLAATNNWGIHQVHGDTLPAGTYTMAINAKRNAGSDQVFSFYIDNTAIRSAPQTATDDWQRFTYTFTLGSPMLMNRIGIGSIDGITDADIQIVDFELYEGSEDLGPSKYGGHLYLGSSAYDARPIYADGTLDVSDGAYGIIQFPTTETFTSMTLQALVSKVDTATGYQSILSDASSYSNFSIMTEQGTVPYSYFNGDAIGPQQSSGLWIAENKGYHVITVRYTGTEFEYWVDDVRMLATSAAGRTVSVNDLFLNLTNVNSLYGGNAYAGAIVLWNRALTPAEIRTAVDVQIARAGASSVPVSKAGRVLVAEGDSITGGFAYSYPYLFGANASPALYGVNYATSGAGLNTFLARAGIIDGIIPPDADGREFILSVFTGANGLSPGYSGPGGTGTAGWLADLATYLDARRTAGWKVVVCTVLPKTDPSFNTERNIANTAIRNWVGVHADAICDFAADPIMGVDATAADTNYYADGLHPTADGQAILETIYRSTINTL